jgi:hypothetical protein
VCLVGLLGAGCTNASIGSRGTKGPGHIAYTYASFNGVERSTVSLDAGQTFDLHYKVDVQQGALSISLVDPNGSSVWNKRFVENATGSDTVTITSGGRYIVLIEGDQASGGYDVSWATR